VEALVADDVLKGLKLKNKKDHQTSDIEVDGTFIAVGSIPITDLVKEIVELDSQGYIVAREDCATNVPGIFAAGDIRQKRLRQIITAAADGAVAVYEAEKYNLENF